MSDAGWRSRIRWVVAHPHRPEALLVERAGRLALPETELGDELWTADATATLPALRELVGVEAVLLRCLSEQEDPSRRVQQATLVATPREMAPLPPGMRWVGREDLAGAALQDDEQAAAVAGVLDELAAGPGRVPWAVPGWFQDAERWLRSSLDAVGQAERRWLALADFGAELEWDTPDAVREDVLRTFARLQIEAASQADRLLEAGCLDRRLPWLADQAERWLPAVEETGRIPGIDAATWLSKEELAELRAAVPQLTAICAELATYAIPPSLVHGDLHLGNVARGPPRLPVLRLDRRRSLHRRGPRSGRAPHRAVPRLLAPQGARRAAPGRSGPPLRRAPRVAGTGLPWMCGTASRRREQIMDVQEAIAQARDTLTVKRVFGEAYEKNGVTIIPAARVQGGAGGGSGEDPQGQGKGSGSGFGVTARPVGAFVLRGDELSWQPAVDINRIVLGGQAVAIVALLVVRAIIKARAKARQ